MQNYIEAFFSQDWHIDTNILTNLENSFLSSYFRQLLNMAESNST